ncbi:carboxylesterase family protein [Caulobacter segnis]|uniref:carboxylesterase/lipase family protein n=1 Tax=Caulobacter segnis TaxID=88688 RepID=UPI00241062D1|nr:carboxylesterase family protein [Caulobacter segnis]MDG2522566.1 carboxylesterase family protein [Caulobacter segnis]
MTAGDFTRRSMLAAAMLGAPMLGAGVSRAAAQDEPVVETRAGRYRGRTVEGVHVFKGMRYGADTAQTGRFMPPRAPETFAGVRDAFDYGDQAPQIPSALADDRPMSEDCLRINVWTPQASRDRKRPVMVWFHGGGFEAGSGSAAVYDGTRMARRGDVVVCTINHRLNVLGFCDLSRAFGDRFAQSGNVGYLDLVAALAWVRDNIEAFGGDPDNVMIYGQSGGGRKVSICFAGKEAAPLFHKGVVQSGSHLMVQTQDQSDALTQALLKALSIAPGDVAALQAAPLRALIVAQRKVIGEAGYRFEPCLDGVSFEAHPFIPNAPAISARKPMMVGTTQTELSNQLGRDPSVYVMDDTQLAARLARFIPAEDVAEALAVFRRSAPQAANSELFFRIVSWKSYIRNAVIMGERRAALNGPNNPTWMYQLTWRSPAEGGRRLSQHTLDLPFMFDNVDKAEHLTGPASDQTRAMTEAMAKSWLAFAHTGDPNHAGLPRWPTYDARRRSTLLFDIPVEPRDDPFSAERRFMDRYDPVRATTSTEG